MATQTRQLTKIEISRLESVIANEERCNKNGFQFQEPDLMEEGKFIMGVELFRASYQIGSAWSESRA